jgi:molybdopterin synthase catalytic subunit
MQNITVRVRAFASLREAVGAGELQITAPAGTDVAGLLAQLAADHPDAGLADKRFAVALNRAYCALDAPLHNGDEVALIPPVSGGAAKLFEITERPISLDAVASRVVASDRGGVTVFAGTVRGITDDTATDYLEYEAYAEMAEPALAAIAAEAQARWPEIAAVSVVHRVGRLEVGEVAVVVAVAASHRRDTFDACRYIIDRIKQNAPIWKKEVGQDGAVWVEGPESTI